MTDLYPGAPWEQAGRPLAFRQFDRLLAFRATHPPQQATLAGVPWHYIASGSGAETLLLLHGGLRIAETAFVYVQIFEGSYRVIVPTYPPLCTMGEVTDGLAALLDNEGVDRALVLGQSYGGTVAQVFLRGHPERVKKLVLSSAHPLIASPRERLLLLPVGALTLALLSLLPGKLPQRVFLKGILAVLALPESERTFWHAYLSDMVLNRLTRADILSLYRSSLDAFRRYAYADGQTSDWPGQVLVIGSENDPTNPQGDWDRMLALYRHAQPCVIPGGGHSVAMSRSEEYGAAVREFLDKDG